MVLKDLYPAKDRYRKEEEYKQLWLMHSADL